LQDYNFKLLHKPGKSMGKADGLNRMKHLNNHNNNQNVVLLPHNVFSIQLCLLELDLSGPNGKLYKRIRNKTSSHVESWVQEALASKESKYTQGNNSVIFYKDKIYVPDNAKLHKDILRARHNTLAAGHPGFMRMKEYIKWDYWWPQLYKDVARYIAGCNECQHIKIECTKCQAPLRPHNVPACPFKVIAADFIGPLTESGCFNFICVITCILSKYIIYMACRNTIDSEGFVMLFHNNAYAYFSMPCCLITDQGPQFVSKFSKVLYKLEGIEGNSSTAYHPQTNGQTKHNNQELKMYLQIWCSYHQDNWHKWLRSVQFSYNNKAHSSTGISLFIAVDGQHPYNDYNLRRQVNIPAASKHAAQHEKTLQEVESALKDAKRRMKEQYNKHVHNHEPYKKGQLVWLDGRNLTTKQPSEKLKDLCFGPFKIVKRIGAGAYKIEIPKM
jgi:hypothetical protein